MDFNIKINSLFLAFDLFYGDGDGCNCVYGISVGFNKPAKLFLRCVSGVGGVL